MIINSNGIVIAPDSKWVVFGESFVGQYDRTQGARECECWMFGLMSPYFLGMQCSKKLALGLIG